MCETTKFVMTILHWKQGLLSDKMSQRYMLHRGTYHYINELKNIVSSYNNKPHRSLIGLAPNEINKDNEAECVGLCLFEKDVHG